MNGCLNWPLALIFTVLVCVFAFVAAASASEDDD